MEPSKPVPPSVRLQELLAVPDRDRTEEEWDELIELEITLAPENRSNRPGGGRSDSAPHPGNGSRRGSKKPGKKRNHREKLPR